MPANPLTDPNWADETTDTVVRLVGNIRDKTTTPLVYAARGLVFGIIAVLLGVFAVIIALPQVTLFLIGVGYVSSGPIELVYRWRTGQGLEEIVPPDESPDAIQEGAAVSAGAPDSSDAERPSS